MDNEKMKELTEEELKKVAGGLDSGDPVITIQSYKNLEGVNIMKSQL